MFDIFFTTWRHLRKARKTKDFKRVLTIAFYLIGNRISDIFAFRVVFLAAIHQLSLKLVRVPLIGSCLVATRLTGWFERLGCMAIEKNRLYLGFTFPAWSRTFREEVARKVSKEFRIVAQRYERALNFPVMVIIDADSRRNQQKVVHGFYMSGSLPLWGFHRIHVALPQLDDGTARHELAHTMNKELNPNIDRLTDEGLAHLVGGENDIDTSLAPLRFLFTQTQWPALATVLHKDDTQERARAWGTAYYLHHVKGMTLPEIARLHPMYFPPLAEIHSSVSRAVLRSYLNEVIAFCDRIAPRRIDAEMMRPLVDWYTEFVAASTDVERGSLIHGAMVGLVDNTIYLMVVDLREKGILDEMILQLAPDDFFQVGYAALMRVKEWVKLLSLTSAVPYLAEANDYLRSDFFQHLLHRDRSSTRKPFENFDGTDFLAEAWAVSYYLLKVKRLSLAQLERTPIEDIPDYSDAIVLRSIFPIAAKAMTQRAAGFRIPINPEYFDQCLAQTR